METQPSLFAFVDTETTGLSVLTDRVIEIGVACYDPSGKLLETWSVLIDAGVEITNTHIHHITTAMTKKGVTLAAALDGLYAIAQRASCFGGHNYERFDLPILLAEARRIGHPLAERLEAMPFVDTKPLASKRKIQPSSLENVYRVISGEAGFKEVHRALDDAKLCAECYFWFQNHPDFCAGV